jgi:hypothetical protein
MDNTILRDNPLVLRRAFMEACAVNKLKEVTWMLQYRELAQDTRTIDEILRRAYKDGHSALAKCVLEHRDVDVTSIWEGTLLHYIIWKSRTFAFDDDIYSWQHLSPEEEESLKDQLTTAAEEGRVCDLIQLSLKVVPISHRYSTLSRNLGFSLDTACSLFDKLLHNGVLRNDAVAQTEAFAVACYRGRLDDVKRLSNDVREDVDMLGMGLHSALVQCYGRNYKHWHIIRWLVDNTQLHNNPLVLRRAFVVACDINELEEVRWMLQHGDLAQDTRTIGEAIRRAREGGHVAVTKCVLEHSYVDVNRTQDGTLLHHAIWMNNDSELHGACLFPKSVAKDVERLVNECGADVNEQNSDGETPLHIACSYGYQDRKRYSDHDSYKPTDIVEALMELGADVNITNDHKQTPAQVARDNKHEELLPLLDSTSLMDTYIRRQRLKLILRNSISVYSTALSVQTYAIERSMLAS